MSLLATKLHFPQARSNPMLRPRLVTILEKGLQGPLITYLVILSILCAGFVVGARMMGKQELKIADPMFVLRFAHKPESEDQDRRHKECDGCDGSEKICFLQHNCAFFQGRFRCSRHPIWACVHGTWSEAMIISPTCWILPLRLSPGAQCSPAL